MAGSEEQEYEADDEDRLATAVITAVAAVLAVIALTIGIVQWTSPASGDSDAPICVPGCRTPPGP